MGPATWIFMPDGSFVARKSASLSGTARVDGNVLTLYTNEAGVQRLSYAIDRDTPIGDVLYLDGRGHVRGEC